MIGGGDNGWQQQSKAVDAAGLEMTNWVILVMDSSI
jgi:hypothetical protein